MKTLDGVIADIERRLGIAVAALRNLDSNFDFDPRAQAIIDKTLDEIC